MAYGSHRSSGRRHETVEPDDILTNIPNISLSDSIYAAHEPALDDGSMDQSHHHGMFDNTMSMGSYGGRHDRGLRDHDHSAGMGSPYSLPSAFSYYGEPSSLSSSQSHSLPHAAPSAPSGEPQNHWVTVFGFPRSRTTDILHIFRQYGEFLDQKSSGGNWVHICYSSKLQAQQALAKNGKIIAGDLMIGVVPCTDDNTWLKPLQMASSRPGPTYSAAPVSLSAAPTAHQAPTITPATLPQSSTGFWQTFWTHAFGY